MAEHNNNRSCAVWAFWIFSAFILVLTLISTSVYVEYEPTLRYEKTWCRATGPLTTNAKSTTAQGKIPGCVSDPEGNCIGKNVTLTYPAVPGYDNTFTDDTAVYTWATAVRTSPAISCHISDDDVPVAYTTLYLYGGSALGMMIMGYLYGFCLLLASICICRYNFQRRVCRNEYEPV